jgi:ribonuclease inhibitor
MQAELDGNEIGTIDAFHRQIAEKLDFGPYYGRNLNALWDMLSGDVERPMHLIWRDSAASREKMGPEAFDMVIEVLQSAQDEDANAGRPQRFTYALE